MRKIWHLIILQLSIILVIPKNCEAGAWTQKQDRYYLRLTGASFQSTSLFSKDGMEETYADGGEFTDLSIYAYLEYGISDFVTLVGSIPFKSLKYESMTLERKTRGASDLYLALRYLLSDRGMVMSLQAGLKVETGYDTELESLDQAPPLGDGQTDFEMRLLLGNTFLNHAAYYSFDAGYRVRSADPVDEIPFGFEAGINLGRIGILIGQIGGVRAISEAQNAVSQIGNQVSLSPVEDFLKAGGQFVLNVSSNVNVAFIYNRVFDGRNTASGRSFGFAIALTGASR